MINRKHFLGMLVIVTAFTMMGCLYSGTYTRNGNTATFRGDMKGTATISGNTMKGTFDGSAFNATRADTSSNSCAGTWTGSMNGKPVEFIIGNNVWAVSVSGSEPEEGGFLENDDDEIYLEGINSEGSAKVSGNTLRGTFDGASFTTTKANTSSNPFMGTWRTVIDGIRVEFVIGNSTWLVAVRE
jgi:hypothetical protein